LAIWLHHVMIFIKDNSILAENSAKIRRKICYSGGMSYLLTKLYFPPE
jgi:hypothetical protein